MGAIYKELADKNTTPFVENGDLTHSFMQSLVNDLNEWVMLNPYEGKSFYIRIKEKKDLQMKRAYYRIPHIFPYRPYPEHDTTCYWVDPNRQEVKFCWDIPHRSLMDNIIINWPEYDKNLVNTCRAWLSEDMSFFGFKWIEHDGKPALKALKENRDLSLTHKNLFVAKN